MSSKVLKKLSIKKIIKLSNFQKEEIKKVVFMVFIVLWYYITVIGLAPHPPSISAPRAFCARKLVTEKMMEFRWKDKSQKGKPI